MYLYNMAFTPRTNPSHSMYRPSRIFCLTLNSTGIIHRKWRLDNKLLSNNLQLHDDGIDIGLENRIVFFIYSYVFLRHDNDTLQLHVFVY